MNEPSSFMCSACIALKIELYIHVHPEEGEANSYKLTVLIIPKSYQAKKVNTRGRGYSFFCI